MKNLPCATINFIKSTSLNVRTKESGRKLVNFAMKVVRLSCHLVLLHACLNYGVIPNFIDNQVKISSDIGITKAIYRKSQSLKLELLRGAISSIKMEKDDINRWFSYEYLNFTRSCSTELCSTILTKIEGTVKAEMELSFERHQRKLSNWTGKNYIIDRTLYEVNYRPSYMFDFHDSFWFDDYDRSHQFISNNKYDSKIRVETDISIPNDILSFLSRGPRFRLPHLHNEHFLKNNQLSILTTCQNYRWKALYDNRDSVPYNKINIPFNKNTVKFPPKLDENVELKLKMFETEAMKIINTEMKYEKSKPLSKFNNQMIRKTKTFLKEKALVVIPSDKTNRLVISDEQSMVNRIEDILSDDITYRKLVKSRNNGIENQANKMIRTYCKNNDRLDIGKLISTGAKPAKFQVRVKDHKDKDESGYPLRPIAAVSNTPTERVDWLVGHLLNKLVKFVPSHLPNTSALIENLSAIKNLTTNTVMFISLDVKNLYTSIPLLEGIEIVSNFAKENWHLIDNYNLDINCIEQFLKLVAFNYEIEFNNIVYLQKKGCPMGSHFGPPFAIIFMKCIEELAFKKLETNNIKPKLYRRYIDDIILGPFANEPSLFNNILEIFNSIHPDIKFTIEAPENGVLNFLDLSISIEREVYFQPYNKENHSGICLDKFSNVPDFVKQNFIKNTINNIGVRCSDSDDVGRHVNDFKKKLRKNNYHWRDVQEKRPKQHSRDENNTNSILQLDFINDATHRKLNKLVKKYDVPFRIVQKPGKQIRSTFSKFNSLNSSTNCSCKICESLNNDHACEKRYVIYKFTCSLCGDFYIGSTNRPFRYRFQEHCRSIDNRDSKSALSVHMSSVHFDHTNTSSIDAFTLSFIDIQNNPIKTRLAESELIRKLKPKINRKDELM